MISHTSLGRMRLWTMLFWILESSLSKSGASKYGEKIQRHKKPNAWKSRWFKIRVRLKTKMKFLSVFWKIPDFVQSKFWSKTYRGMGNCNVASRKNLLQNIDNQFSVRNISGKVSRYIKSFKMKLEMNNTWNTRIQYWPLSVGFDWKSFHNGCNFHQNTWV